MQGSSMSRGMVGGACRRPSRRSLLLAFGAICAALLMAALALPAGSHSEGGTQAPGRSPRPPLHSRTAAVAPQQVAEPQDGGAFAYARWTLPTADAGLMMPAVGPDGHVWVGEMTANRLAVLQPDGRVGFSNMGGGMIDVLDPRDGRVQSVAVPAARATTGVAVASDGTVWSAVQDGALGRPRSGEQRPEPFPLASGSAYGVALDADGTIWVATSGAAVDGFDPTSGRLARVRTGDGAWWLTAARDGSIWVAEGSAAGNALGRISPPS